MTKTEEAIKQAEAGIAELAAALEAGHSEALVRFLEFQARFHRYSFQNCLLILLQRPTASSVAGFMRWKQLGRSVKKGEKGIMIFAPLISRKRADKDMPTTNIEERPRVLVGFRVAFVFDVSQTEGVDLPGLNKITGHPGELLPRLQQCVRERGIELSSVEDLGGPLGVSRGGSIEILARLTPAEEFTVTAHELAHELLHRSERRQETEKGIRELEAEAVAFLVARAAGLDAALHAADYIQLYGGNRDLLTQSLSQVQRVGAEIIEALGLSDPQEVHRAA